MDDVQNENLDSLNETEGIDTANEETVVDTGTEEQVAKLKDLNRKLFERAKRAEGFVLKDGHWVKPATPPQTQPVVVPQVTPTPDISDELRLLAKGLSDEEIDEAKSIAKGKGLSLTEALKTKTFLLYQADLKEEKRKEEAKLGASHGSGLGGDENLVKPGMTAEQHKEAWKKAQGI